jgi:hypothetical protein
MLQIRIQSDQELFGLVISGSVLMESGSSRFVRFVIISCTVDAVFLLVNDQIRL